MRHAAYGWALLTILLGFTPDLRGDVIFSGSFTAASAFPIDSPRVRLEFSIVVDPYDDLLTPLLSQYVTPADVGKTFVADPSTPNFAKNVDVLMNGANDRIFLAQKDASGSPEGWGAQGWYEAGFLYGAPHGPVDWEVVDLKDSQVERVTMSITAFTKVADSNQPEHGPNWGLYVIKGTVAFEGLPPSPPPPPPVGGGGPSGGGVGPPVPGQGAPPETPEPASIFLAGVGAIGLVGMVRRRRSRLGGG